MVSLSTQELQRVSGGCAEVVAMAAVFGILLAADAGLFDAAPSLDEMLAAYRAGQ